VNGEGNNRFFVVVVVVVVVVAAGFSYLNSLCTGSLNRLIARLAQRIVHSMVMSSTIRRISKHIKALVRERAAAGMAPKTG
jgi:hypothetical protein